MNNNRKVYIVIAILLGFLALTNPTYEDFRNYKGTKRVQREANFIIFSIYRTADTRYIGFIKNFIFVKRLPYRDDL